MADIELQDGPQKLASKSKATVIFYGGAKGGGKTRWLVHEIARHHDQPGYGAVIFRRTFGELKGIGSIWEECQKIYPLLGAEMTESRLEAKFPMGATVHLSHLQHPKDAEKWKGKSLPTVGIDEITHFVEEQWWSLLSCLRSASGIKTRFLATCNPDPDSWVLQFVAWYIDDAGFPIKERSGKVRWFGRIDGKLRWFDSEGAAHAAGVETPTSFTFIASNVFDNAILLKNDKQYLANLRALPPVEQARFLGGNWRVRQAAGDYFQEAYFPRIPLSTFDRKAAGLPSPNDVVRVWRAWDLAGTPVEGDTVVGAPRETRTTQGAARTDADWTRGIKFGETRDGRLIWLDTRSARDTSGAIEWFIKRTAERDGPHVVQVFFQDPAQAGVHQVTIYERLLRGTAQTAFCLPMKPLDVGALTARACWAGKVLVPAGASWFEECIRELESFPNGNHDDVASALGLAYVYQLEVPGAGKGKVLPVDDTPRLEEGEERLEEHWAARHARGRDRNDIRGGTTSGRFRIF